MFADRLDCRLTWKRTLQRDVKCCVCQGWGEGTLLWCEKDTFCVGLSRGAQNRHPSAGGEHGALWRGESGIMCWKVQQDLNALYCVWLGRSQSLTADKQLSRSQPRRKKFNVFTLFSTKPRVVCLPIPLAMWWAATLLSVWGTGIFLKDFSQETRRTGTVQCCPGPALCKCLPVHHRLHSLLHTLPKKFGCNLRYFLHQLLTVHSVFFQ